MRKNSLSKSLPPGVQKKREKLGSLKDTEYAGSNRVKNRLISVSVYSTEYVILRGEVHLFHDRAVEKHLQKSRQELPFIYLVMGQVLWLFELTHSRPRES